MRGYLYARYLGYHVLTESRQQLQLPLFARAEHGHAAAVALAGLIAAEVKRGRDAGGCQQRRRPGPATVVGQGMHTRPIGLRQKKIVGELAKSNK